MTNLSNQRRSYASRNAAGECVGCVIRSVFDRGVRGDVVLDRNDTGCERIFSSLRASQSPGRHIFGLHSYGGEGAGQLSQREKDCVTHIAAGDRIDSIAQKMGLAKVTVELHLKRARKKLGAATLAHAVAKALARGEIIFADI